MPAGSRLSTTSRVADHSGWQPNIRQQPTDRVMAQPRNQATHEATVRDFFGEGDAKLIYTKPLPPG